MHSFHTSICLVAAVLLPVLAPSPLVSQIVSCPDKPTASVGTDSLTKCLVMQDSLTLSQVHGMGTTRGNSYVSLSLIKSVAGQIPKSEFFDLRFKLSTPHTVRLFTTANLDVALSQSESDTATNSRLTDAGFQFNWVVPRLFPLKPLTPSLRHLPDNSDTLIYDRVTALTGGYKLFNTVSYFVIGISGHELKGSRLEGSFASLSYAHRLLANPTINSGTDTTDVTRARALHNLLFEFFIRVPGVQFLDKLRVRGGLLLPMKAGYAVETRIVLEVPIVDVTRF